jgi:hypothetical protein
MRKINHLFQYASIITGILVFIMGFDFHWIGQSISIMNRNLAMRIGIREKDNQFVV